MAVESRFVVVRNGVEVNTFMDKKAADEYDKMLDMADNLSVLLDQSTLELDEQTVEDISIFLAKNREQVLVSLLAKKPKPETKKSTNASVEVKKAKAATKKSAVADDAKA
ncbi:YebG family protein [Thalassotalea ponticola]|uniref:YebG family protein n=1 Tax=Thalassotalea ponticola TaxID=1523392 RepID=UPI0025B3BA51|nr:YebG family protein [Thalassotalea ponticola]MDN3652044.1 YebG family protein [Thalassotalea ponticola]